MTKPIMPRKPIKRVMLHAFGPATVLRVRTYRVAGDVYFTVRSDSGHEMDLSTRYVDKLRVIDQKEMSLESE